jgi:flagellar export protein FliJ
MTDFRFRAQVALDLRRRQEDAAATVLARAEAALREVAGQLAAAGVERQSALAGQLDAQRAGIDAGALEWHWNWINRLAATVERLGRDLEVRRLAAGEAERAWREARRRRLALERMRDRALHRHQGAQHRKEVKTIDELARLRFVLPDTRLGRDNRDD